MPLIVKVSAIILMLWVILIVVEPVLSIQPNQIQLDKILSTPSLSDNNIHALLGYDDLGRSIFDRLISGAKISFAVAFSVALISLIIGTFIGVISAYVGGVWDHITLRFIDVFMAFPGILLAIALSGLMGAGISNVIIALCVVSWVGYARLARAQVLAIKQREHVTGAIALGVSHRFILLRHILPLILSPLLIEFTFGIAGLIIAEAGLSFLGLGIQAPDSSWGNMIKNGSQYLLIAPHMVIVPGLALMIIVFSINQLGDGIRDYLDPKRQFSNKT
ncbi:MAG: ABC transporter permease [Pseudomonadota bacterium]